MSHSLFVHAFIWLWELKEFLKYFLGHRSFQALVPIFPPPFPPTPSDSAEPGVDAGIYPQGVISRACFSTRKPFISFSYFCLSLDKETQLVSALFFPLVIIISCELHFTAPRLWLSSEVLSDWKYWMEIFKDKEKYCKANKNLLKPVCCKILFKPHQGPNWQYI